MTTDGMEFFDMYKSMRKDRGIGTLYGTPISIRYRQRTIPGAVFTVFTVFQAFIGRILLKSGQALVSIGERVAGFQTSSAGSAGSAGRNNTAQVSGGFAR